MNFFLRLLVIKKNNGILVIIDRLTKSAHFVPLRTCIWMDHMAHLYIKEVVRLHGVRASIVLDRDNKFVSRVWTTFQEALETELNFSTAHQPQTDGQTKRTNLTLEDILRARVLDF